MRASGEQATGLLGEIYRDVERTYPCMPLFCDGECSAAVAAHRSALRVKWVVT